jgi:hypothetical protein
MAEFRRKKSARIVGPVVVD